MEQNTIYDPPNRVTDLITMKEKGLAVTCRTFFEILPVDFFHRKNPFQAYVFLCRYTGTINRKDYINIAKEGNEVSVNVDLEYVPAVEHFAHHKNRQIFLMVDFTITCFGKAHHYERCLACYPAEKERKEKKRKAQIANDRLKILYAEFDEASMKCNKNFFE